MYTEIKTAKEFHQALQSGVVIEYTAYKQDTLQEGTGWIESSWNNAHTRKKYSLETICEFWAELENLPARFRYKAD